MSNNSADGNMEFLGLVTLFAIGGLLGLVWEIVLPVVGLLYLCGYLT